MAKYIFFAYSDCADPAREKEFNDWYNEVHVPDMLETPGMIRATRWENVHPRGNPRKKYIAMYEIETDDIKKFDEMMRETGKKSKQKGRLSELVVLDPPEVPRVLYKQIMPPKAAKSIKPKTI